MGDGVPVGVAGSGVDVAVEVDVGDAVAMVVAVDGTAVVSRVAVAVGVSPETGRVGDGVAMRVGVCVTVCPRVGVALPCTACTVGAEARPLCQAAAPHTASAAHRKQIVQSSVRRCLTGTAFSSGWVPIIPQLGRVANTNLPTRFGNPSRPPSTLLIRPRTLHSVRGGCIMAARIRHKAAHDTDALPAPLTL